MGYSVIPYFIGRRQYATVDFMRDGGGIRNFFLSGRTGHGLSPRFTDIFVYVCPCSSVFVRANLRPKTAARGTLLVAVETRDWKPFGVHN
jgi:hypothetical protein